MGGRKEGEGGAARAYLDNVADFHKAPFLFRPLLQAPATGTDVKEGINVIVGPPALRCLPHAPIVNQGNAGVGFAILDASAVVLVAVLDERHRKDKKQREHGHFLAHAGAMHTASGPGMLAHSAKRRLENLPWQRPEPWAAS
jgi:hypothetical protein